MSSSWWSKDTVAVVTGANRGIGLSLVRQLAEKGLTVVLTSRDATKGQAAADDLVAKGLNLVVFHQLDTSDLKSAENLASWLKSEHGGLDILINNAAVAPLMDKETKKYRADTKCAEYVLGINYYGVKKVTNTLLPLLKASKEGARIINVTSRNGLYERLQSEDLKKIFRDEDSYTEDLADSLAATYLEDVQSGKHEEKWVTKIGGQVYAESKMFLNLYSSALAKSLEKSSQTKGGREVFVAGMCPGATLTDMMQSSIANGRGPPPGFPMKSVDDGAETAVWLALLPKEEWEGKQGKLFGERTEYLFGWKNPGF